MDRVAIIALLFTTLGCTPIDGGAVEASWVVATPDGRLISDCGCTCPAVAKIRLQLLPVGGGNDPCAGGPACSFSCNQQSGATHFDIAPGPYSISLVPMGADGADLIGGIGTCGAPVGSDPVERDVIKGQVTQLPAMLVQADCAAECGGSDNQRVCTK
jgi:hypothetical protein